VRELACRGAGAITLQALVWMARERPASFALLMRKQQGVRSDWEYPFAAGGMNVAWMLTGGARLWLAGPAGAVPVPVPMQQLWTSATKLASQVLLANCHNCPSAGRLHLFKALPAQ